MYTLHIHMYIELAQNRKPITCEACIRSHSRFLNWSSWEHHTVVVYDAKCIVWRQTRVYSWNTFPACHLLSWCMAQNDHQSVNMRMSNANCHEWTYFERGEIPLERTALTCIEYRNILLYWLFVKSVYALANLLETFCWLRHTDIQTNWQTDRHNGTAFHLLQLHSTAEYTCKGIKGILRALIATGYCPCL